MKKNGGKIKNWQLHSITVLKEQEERFLKFFPNVIMPPILFTGTIVDDPTGRWMPGFHMRSTYIVSFDREKGVIETLNTTYKLDMKTEGKDVMPDLGNNVLKIFY